MRPERLLAAAALLCALATTALAQAAEAAPRGGKAAAIRAALRSAPFYTETFAPSREAEGVVITLHRGAWAGTGRQAAATEHADAHAWLRRRWLVVNSSYRPGTAGLADVLSAYRRVAAAVRGTLPICMVGASAGGNLALLAATRLPDVGCVVAEAAPTDLVNISSQAAYDPNAEGGASPVGPTYVHDAAVQALGADNLRRFSPLFVAHLIKARVLLAEAERDPLIPAQQLSDLCARLRSRCVRRVQLAPGPLNFVHGRVSRAALSRYRLVETKLARRVVADFRAARDGRPTTSR